MGKKSKSDKSIYFLIKLLKIVLFIDTILFLLLSIVSPWFLVLSISFFVFFILCKERKPKKKKRNKVNKVEKNPTIVNLEDNNLEPADNRKIEEEEIVHTGIKPSFPVVNNYNPKCELDITIPIEIEYLKCSEEELEELSAFIDLYESKNA